MLVTHCWLAIKVNKNVLRYRRLLPRLQDRYQGLDNTFLGHGSSRAARYGIAQPGPDYGSIAH